MKAGKIRPLAICVFSHQGRILVSEGYDSVKKQTFYRPLGGKIEFGEPSAETVRRELLEEIGYEVGDLHYLATLENIFTYNGQKGHEIILIYDGDFKDKGFTGLAEIEGHEEEPRAAAGDLEAPERFPGGQRGDDPLVSLRSAPDFAPEVKFSRVLAYC